VSGTLVPWTGRGAGVVDGRRRARAEGTVEVVDGRRRARVEGTAEVVEGATVGVSRSKGPRLPLSALSPSAAALVVAHLGRGSTMYTTHHWARCGASTSACQGRPPRAFFRRRAIDAPRASLLVAPITHPQLPLCFALSARASARCAASLPTPRPPNAPLRATQCARSTWRRSTTAPTA
jgi:hypothetical protein